MAKQGTKAKAPGVAAPGVFLSVLRRTRPLVGLRLSLISLQPIANIVANYTSQYGDNKSEDVIQGTDTSFQAEVPQHEYYIMSCRKTQFFTGKYYQKSLVFYRI